MDVSLGLRHSQIFRWSFGSIDDGGSAHRQGQMDSRIVVMPSFCAALRFGPMSSRNTTSDACTLSRSSACL